MNELEMPFSKQKVYYSIKEIAYYTNRETRVIRDSLSYFKIPICRSSGNSTVRLPLKSFSRLLKCFYIREKLNLNHREVGKMATKEIEQLIENYENT